MTAQNLSLWHAEVKDAEEVPEQRVNRLLGNEGPAQPQHSSDRDRKVWSVEPDGLEFCLPHGQELPQPFQALSSPHVEWGLSHLIQGSS